TQVFPFLEIPNWAVRLVVLLLVIGFPVALILGWVMEIFKNSFRSPIRKLFTSELPLNPRDSVWLTDYFYSVTDRYTSMAAVISSTAIPSDLKMVVSSARGGTLPLSASPNSA